MSRTSKRRCGRNTRLVFVETIANPRTQIADLARIGELCRARGILYVVDNTMTTPYLFRPKAVGAGLVVNSLTKSIGGHGMALGGALTDTGLFDWSAFPNIADNFRKQPPAAQGMAQLRAKALRDFGASLGPEAAHHIAVGAETLALRMERTSANALALAQMLEADERVAAVHYPGLASHPQHALATELFRAYGSLFSFELKDGIDCFDYLNRLRVAIPASNLGDTRTLVIPVAHTIFFEMGAERRASMGIAESLIRVSVGIEDTDDLLADFPDLPAASRTKAEIQATSDAITKWESCYQGFVVAVNAGGNPLRRIPADVLQLMSPREAEQAGKHIDAALAQLVDRRQAEAFSFAARSQIWFGATSKLVLAGHTQAEIDGERIEYDIRRYALESKPVRLRTGPIAIERPTGGVVR
jgi:hypothetical protein